MKWHTCGICKKVFSPMVPKQTFCLGCLANQGSEPTHKLSSVAKRRYKELYQKVLCEDTIALKTEILQLKIELSEDADEIAMYMREIDELEEFSKLHIEKMEHSKMTTAKLRSMLGEEKQKDPYVDDIVNSIS